MDGASTNSNQCDRSCSSCQLIETHSSAHEIEENGSLDSRDQTHYKSKISASAGDDIPSTCSASSQGVTSTSNQPPSIMYSMDSPQEQSTSANRRLFEQSNYDLSSKHSSESTSTSRKTDKENFKVEHNNDYVNVVSPQHYECNEEAPSPSWESSPGLCYKCPTDDLKIELLNQKHSHRSRDPSSIVSDDSPSSMPHPSLYVNSSSSCAAFDISEYTDERQHSLCWEVVGPQQHPQALVSTTAHSVQRLTLPNLPPGMVLKIFPQPCPGCGTTEPIEPNVEYDGQYMSLFYGALKFKLSAENAGCKKGCWRNFCGSRE